MLQQELRGGVDVEREQPELAAQHAHDPSSDDAGAVEAFLRLELEAEPLHERLLALGPDRLGAAHGDHRLDQFGECPAVVLGDDVEEAVAVAGSVGIGGDEGPVMVRDLQRARLERVVVGLHRLELLVQRYVGGDQRRAVPLHRLTDLAVPGHGHLLAALAQVIGEVRHILLVGRGQLVNRARQVVQHPTHLEQRVHGVVLVHEQVFGRADQTVGRDQRQGLARRGF